MHFAAAEIHYRFTVRALLNQGSTNFACSLVLKHIPHVGQQDNFMDFFFFFFDGPPANRCGGPPGFVPGQPWLCRTIWTDASVSCLQEHFDTLIQISHDSVNSLLLHSLLYEHILRTLSNIHQWHRNAPNQTQTTLTVRSYINVTHCTFVIPSIVGSKKTGRGKPNVWEQEPAIKTIIIWVETETFH